ncbi:hypothetical protein D3C86_1756020 [compost metagenome]
MDLDAIEACGNSVCRGLAEIVDDPGQFVERQRPRLGNVDKAVVDERFGCGPNGRGRHRSGAVLL